MEWRTSIVAPLASFKNMFLFIIISPSSAGILTPDEDAGGTTTENADFVPLLLLPVVTPVVDWCVVNIICEFGSANGNGLVFGCCWLFTDPGDTAKFIIFFLFGESGLLAVEIAGTTKLFVFDIILVVFLLEGANNESGLNPSYGNDAGAPWLEF